MKSRKYLTALMAFAMLAPMCLSVSSQSPPYNTITDAQYAQLRIAVVGNKGHVSQKWGEYYSGNVTSCGNSLEKLHPGVDIAEIEGTAVITPVGGEVTNVIQGADCSKGSCLSQVAIYNSQTNKTSVFLHMETFNVSIGQIIPAGWQVGTVGKRGAGAYHVHYEVRDQRQTRAAACISSTVDPYANTPLSNPPPPPPPPVTDGATNSWDFNTDGNFQGWTVTNASSSAVHDGILFIDPSGNDPYMTSPSFSRNLLTNEGNAILYPFVKVKMASNGLDGTGAIYFKTTGSNYYSEDKKVLFGVNNCSLCGTAPFYEYTVPMSGYFGGNYNWNGTITGIRLDPTGSGKAGVNSDSIGVDYIRLAGWGDLGGAVGDDSGPALSVTSHSDGQTVSTNTVTIYGTASDAGLGDNGISSVSVNGVRAQSDTASGSGTAFWSQTVNLGQGQNTISVTASDASDLRLLTTQTITINYQPSTPAPTGLQYYPLVTPIRLLETRPGQPGYDTPGQPLSGNTTRSELGRGLNYNGAAIPATAQALVGNATVINSAEPGHIILYPSGVQMPTVSSLNYPAGQIVNNAFTVALGSDGRFNVYTPVTTNIVIDVAGYYAPPSPGGLYFHVLPTPIRLLETRPGQPGYDTPGSPLAAMTSRVEQARVSYNGMVIPAAAQAIVGNVAVVNNLPGATSGHIILYPSNAALPTVSNLNYVAGQIVPNAFTVGLDGGGNFSIYAHSQTHLVIDVTGYYSADAMTDVNGAAALLYYPLPSPVRLLETRPGQPGCDTPGQPLVGDSSRWEVARVGCGVDASAEAVVGNATVVNTAAGSQDGYIILYPSSAFLPVVSNLNFVAGQIVGNNFTVGLGADGAFNIYSPVSTHFVIDLNGYFTDARPSRAGL